MYSRDDVYTPPLSWVLKEALKLCLIIALVVAVAFAAVACGA